MAEDRREFKALFERLQRLETRLVAGFEELGVCVTSPEGWCKVDNKGHCVYLRGPSRSIRSIQLAIAQAGGDREFYTILFEDEVIATVRMSEKSQLT